MSSDNPFYVPDEDRPSYSDDEEPNVSREKILSAAAARAQNARARSYLEDDLDVMEYDSDEGKDESDTPYITIEDDDYSIESSSSDQSEPFPETIELESIILTCGTIRAGDTVELKDKSNRGPGRLVSGDFLRLTEIVEDISSGNVKLRGERFRRISYMMPLFDFKNTPYNINELFKLVSSKTNDSRPAHLQGLIEVDPQDVVRIRQLLITNATYPSHSVQEVPIHLPRSNMTKEERKKFIFNEGRLCCRYVFFEKHHTNGESYEGMIRAPHKEECSAIIKEDQSPSRRHAACGPLDCANRAPRHQPSHQRTRSFEILDEDPRKGRKLPSEAVKFTFGDMFCGAGMGSKGAEQAGLKVVWGIDDWKDAIEAYGENFPGATPIKMDATNFADWADRRNFSTDIIHYSCPCQYWSFAHTNPGKDDEKNRASIFIPVASIEKLKPRIVTFEQTDGLIRTKEHKVYFRGLLNDMLKNGYKVRYKIQDLVELGVPQRRKRLLIIGARKGTPLPPFPRPTCGRPGSGLANFQTIWDALKPLRNDPMGHEDDERHNPHQRPIVPKATPFDPKRSLMKALTCDGNKDNYHPTELRKITVREALYFQSCPPGFYVAGSQTSAMKQAGNGFPCKAAEALFLSCAQTLEAFEHGYIDDQEDVEDLWETLTEKEISIPTQEETRSRSLLGGGPRSASHTKFRYLNRLVQTPAPRIRHNFLARAIEFGRPAQEIRKKRRVRSGFGLFDGAGDEPDEEEDVAGPSRPRKRRVAGGLDLTLKEQLWIAQDSGNVIELDDD